MARTNFFRALTVALSAALAASLLALVGSLVVLVEAQPTTLPRQGEQVEATGLLSPVFPPSSYSHLLNDVTGGFYFLRSSVADLYSFDTPKGHRAPHVGERPGAAAADPGSDPAETGTGT